HLETLALGHKNIVIVARRRRYTGMVQDHDERRPLVCRSPEQLADQWLPRVPPPPVEENDIGPEVADHALDSGGAPEASPVGVDAGGGGAPKSLDEWRVRDDAVYRAEVEHTVLVTQETLHQVDEHGFGPTVRQRVDHRENFHRAASVPSGGTGRG